MADHAALGLFVPNLAETLSLKAARTANVNQPQSILAIPITARDNVAVGRPAGSGDVAAACLSAQVDVGSTDCPVIKFAGYRGDGGLGRGDGRVRAANRADLVATLRSRLRSVPAAEDAEPEMLDPNRLDLGAAILVSAFSPASEGRLWN